MKFIHVVIIVAMFGFAISQICEGYKFENIKYQYVYYNGNLDFSTSFDIKKAKDLKTFEITKIENSLINYTWDGKKNNSALLFSEIAL
jgi:hypothetical protein